MNTDKIVQFIAFETTLNATAFNLKLNEFSKSSNSETDFTLQQTEKSGAFKYVTQHRLEASETKFLFTKPKKTSKAAEVSLREKQAGGYSIIQQERKNDLAKGEQKIFVFFIDSVYDYTEYKQLCTNATLNIYEAYYQNSTYTAILEIFVEKDNAANLVEALKEITTAEIGIYASC